MHDQRKLVGALSAQKNVLYAPLLKWYLEHGLKTTAVHGTIDYVPQKVSSVSSKKSRKTGARVPKIIGGGSVQVVWQQLIWQANRSLENADDREGTNGASAKLGCSS